jgi:hypothetical protein
MAISGLVLTLQDESVANPTWLSRLEADPRVEVGEVRGARVALTVETDDRVGDESAWSWLAEQPGVLQLELACVLYPEDDMHNPRNPANPTEGKQP